MLVDQQLRRRAGDHQPKPIEALLSNPLVIALARACMIVGSALAALAVGVITYAYADLKGDASELKGTVTDIRLSVVEIKVEGREAARRVGELERRAWLRPIAVPEGAP